MPIRRILSLYSEYEEENIMYEQTNPSIKCSVNSCTYHKNQHCTLNEIQVGCCAENVAKPDGTECASFIFQQKSNQQTVEDSPARPF